MAVNTMRIRSRVVKSCCSSTRLRDQLEETQKQLLALELSFKLLSRNVENRLSIVSNSVQYMEALAHGAHDMAKPCYDFLKSTDQFTDWLMVENFTKEVYVVDEDS